jgi:hypothetical protein
LLCDTCRGRDAFHRHTGKSTLDKEIVRGFKDCCPRFFTPPVAISAMFNLRWGRFHRCLFGSSARFSDDGCHISP